MTSTEQPVAGHDGPYGAPVTVTGQIVRPEWIDYNGHMNVGYYGVALDKALDVMFDRDLGLGEARVAAVGQGPYVLQSHMHFLREVLEGQEFAARFHLLDWDHKRLHLFTEMRVQPDDTLAATQELIIMNVDHATGRSAPYPDWAQKRLARMHADHQGLDRPPQRGASIGLRR